MHGIPRHGPTARVGSLRRTRSAGKHHRPRPPRAPAVDPAADQYVREQLRVARLRGQIQRRIWWRENGLFLSVIALAIAGTLTAVEFAAEFAVRQQRGVTEFELLQTGVLVAVAAVTLPSLLAFWRSFRLVAQGEKNPFYLLYACLSVVAILVIFAIGYLVCGIYTSCDEGRCRIYDFNEALYFSAITIMTVGYGDILPMGWSRLLAATEPMIGVIMFGMLVSALGIMGQAPPRRHSYYDFALRRLRREGVDGRRALRLVSELEQDVGPEWFERDREWRNFPGDDD